MKAAARPRLVALIPAVALLLAAPSQAAAAVVIPAAPNCSVFPDTNVWNKRVDSLPVHPRSAELKRSIGLGSYLHPDFGSYSGYGIPFNVVGSSQARSTVRFD